MFSDQARAVLHCSKGVVQTQSVIQRDSLQLPAAPVVVTDAGPSGTRAESIGEGVLDILCCGERCIQRPLLQTSIGWLTSTGITIWTPTFPLGGELGVVVCKGIQATLSQGLSDTISKGSGGDMPPPNGFALAHHGPGQLESALPLGAGLATGCIHWELGAAVAGEGVQHLPFSSSSSVPTGVAFVLHSPGHHPGASGVTDVKSDLVCV